MRNLDSLLGTALNSTQMSEGPYSFQAGKKPGSSKKDILLQLLPMLLSTGLGGAFGGWEGAGSATKAFQGSQELQRQAKREQERDELDRQMAGAQMENTRSGTSLNMARIADALKKQAPAPRTGQNVPEGGTLVDPASGQVIYKSQGKPAPPLPAKPLMGSLNPKTGDFHQIRPGAQADPSRMAGILDRIAQRGNVAIDTEKGVTQSREIKEALETARKNLASESKPASPTSAAGTVETDRGRMQWNPTTQRYDIFVGNLPKTEAEKKVGTGKEAADDLAKQAVDTIDLLYKHPGFSSAVGAKGASSGYGAKEKPIAGSDAAGFVAQVDRLKSLLALPNLQYLKGLGAMSDKEFTTIQASVAALDRDMTEAEFKTELGRINDALNKKLGGPSSGPSKPKADPLGLFAPPRG